MSKKKIRVTKGAHSRSAIRTFHINEGLPPIEVLREELDEMRQILLGREEPPLQKGVITLMEVAEAFFSRACEIEQLILEATSDGRIGKTSPYYSFRSQEIRSFKEMSKSATELGSRRLTYENLRWSQETRGMESG